MSHACLLCSFPIDKRAPVVNEVARFDVPQVSVKCPVCSLVQVRDLPSPSELRAYYESGTYRTSYPSGLRGDLKAGDVGYQATLDPSFIARRANRMRLRYNLDKTKNLLDVGCGTGMTALAVNRMTGAPVYGDDLDPKCLEEAYLSGVLPMEKDWTYDVVYGIHSLEHFLAPLVHLEDMRRYANGGHVHVEVPNLNNYKGQSDWQWPHLVNFTPETLWLMMSQAGLKNIWIEDFDHFLTAGGRA